MIGIIDLGISNIVNVCKLLDRLKERFKLINDPIFIKDCEIIIIPGVGSFDEGMKRLYNLDLVNELKKHCNNGKMLIGICLGLQLMMKHSEESDGILGLNLFDQKIKKFFVNKNEKKIHVGWNEIFFEKSDELFFNFNNKNFYFTHSFYLDKFDAKILASTKFNDNSIKSFFIKNNLVGCQFHLELSGKNGFNLMKKILEYKRNYEIKNYT